MCSLFFLLFVVVVVEVDVNVVVLFLCFVVVDDPAAVAVVVVTDSIQLFCTVLMELLIIYDCKREYDISHFHTFTFYVFFAQILIFASKIGVDFVVVRSFFYFTTQRVHPLIRSDVIHIV